MNDASIINLPVIQLVSKQKYNSVLWHKINACHAKIYRCQSEPRGKTLADKTTNREESSEHLEHYTSSLPKRYRLNKNLPSATIQI